MRHVVAAARGLRGGARRALHRLRPQERRHHVRRARRGGRVAGPHIAGLDSHAPTELVAAADATWNGDLDLYGMLLACFGAAVMHSVKKIGLVVDSSHKSEAIASAKAGKLVAGGD